MRGAGREDELICIAIVKRLILYFHLCAPATSVDDLHATTSRGPGTGAGAGVAGLATRLAMDALIRKVIHR